MSEHRSELEAKRRAAFEAELAEELEHEERESQARAKLLELGYVVGGAGRLTAPGPHGPVSGTTASEILLQVAHKVAQAEAAAREPVPVARLVERDGLEQQPVVLSRTVRP